MEFTETGHGMAGWGVGRRRQREVVAWVGGYLGGSQLGKAECWGFLGMMTE